LWLKDTAKVAELPKFSCLAEPSSACCTAIRANVAPSASCFSATAGLRVINDEMRKYFKYQVKLQSLFDTTG